MAVSEEVHAGKASGKCRYSYCTLAQSVLVYTSVMSLTGFAYHEDDSIGNWTSSLITKSHVVNTSQLHKMAEMSWVIHSRSGTENSHVVYTSWPHKIAGI